MAPTPPTTVVPVLVMSLVAWRILRRVRKNIGRQPVQTKRMIARIVILSVFTVVLAVLSYFSTPLMVGMICGLVLGVPLALFALHLTRFEETPEGHFYTPNTYIGVGLSIVLVLRLIFQMTRAYTLSATAGTHYPAMMQSGLTRFLFALIAGFYITYYAGVLIRAHGLVKK